MVSILILVAIIKLAIVALDTVLLAPVVAAVSMFDQRAAYRVCQLWVWINLFVCGVRVHVHRLAALDPQVPYVFMSNHVSQYDVLAVVAALEEFQLRWVAKKELTRIPVFGWALRRAGHIIIDRSDQQQAIASLRAARSKMAEGLSVMIFPEGTRGTAGTPLLPFKKGGFMLALETGFPIVPLAIRGSGRLLPRGSLSPLGGDIEVVVGPPIPVTGLDRDELMARVRAFLAAYGQDATARSGRELAAEAV
jgi:1-acyl-sn-glycerol-3-phosphate acyltransferase